MQHKPIWLFWICILLVMMGIAGCSKNQITPALNEKLDISTDLYIRQVAEGVFVITHAFPWPGNSMIVAMKNGDLVLVDTPYTPEATEEVLEWATEQFGERSITAINTGFHYDNLGGNSYLVQENIPVYGSQLTVELLEERGTAFRAMTLDWLQAPKYQSYYQVHETLPYVPPTQQFNLEEGLLLEFGQETVEVYYPGPTHSPDNVVVYFPDHKLLFGGCMILGEGKIGNTSDADLEAWPESVSRLSQFDFDILIPGHGERFDPALLEETLTLLSTASK